MDVTVQRVTLAVPIASYRFLVVYPAGSGEEAPKAVATGGYGD